MPSSFLTLAQNNPNLNNEKFQELSSELVQFTLTLVDWSSLNRKIGKIINLG